MCRAKIRVNAFFFMFSKIKKRNSFSIYDARRVTKFYHDIVGLPVIKYFVKTVHSVFDYENVA